MAASRQRLKEGCESGDYYEALIFYKSALSRKMNNKAKEKDAFTMIIEGVKTAWEYATSSSNLQPVAPAAIDIGGQVTTLWEIHDRTASADGITVVIDQLRELFSAMPMSTVAAKDGSSFPAGSAEKSELFGTILKWASGQKTSITSRPGEACKGDHLEALKLLQAEACNQAGRAYDEAGETRKAYSHLLNGFPTVPESTLFVEFIVNRAKATNNPNEGAAWRYRGALHIMLRPSANLEKLTEAAKMVLSATLWQGHPLIKLGLALVSLINVSTKVGGGSGSNTSGLREVGDSLYEANKETLLDRLDSHLSELTVICLQKYNLTEKNKKTETNGGMGSMLGNIMSMLGGGGN